MISKCKVRPTLDVCADCGASDPSWASINRGLVLCAECCSVHRSLGRHISHVKSLHQGNWPPSLLNMVHTLTAQNANSVWEHSLLDSTAPKHLRRKPLPKDPLHPTKSEFIVAKHVRLAYVLRARRDEPAAELGRQLHSAVRSGALHTALRLLAQGADPNYFSHEKGTMCLHVACRAGQAAQCELLVAWGALPAALDRHGHAPADHAAHAGHLALADRMRELVYEVTDRLIQQLTGRRPDHAAGQHFLVPELGAHSHEMTDVAKAARGKLQLLPNHLFEELVMDIYDEVDRRETEAAWQTSAAGVERCGVVFLPVNPALSAPRNQGRQKLARLSGAEMAALLRDVLADAMRRQHLATLKPHAAGAAGMALGGQVGAAALPSDDEPLYDSVAEDDDYAALKPIKAGWAPRPAETVSSQYNPSVPSELTSAHTLASPPAAAPAPAPAPAASDPQIEHLKKELDCRDSTINELKTQLKSLQTIVERLTHENSALKSDTDDSLKTDDAKEETKAEQKECVKRDVVERGKSLENEVAERGRSLDSEVSRVEELRVTGKSLRPVSMFETSEGHRNNWQVTRHQLRTVSGLDAWEERVVGRGAGAAPEGGASLPEAGRVHAAAEAVTRALQDAWAAAQRHAASTHAAPGAPAAHAAPTAPALSRAVHSLLQLFPKNCEEREVSAALSQLESACAEFAAAVCAGPAPAPVPAPAPPGPAYLQRVRAAAYQLASATKLLVTHFPLDT